MMQYTIENELFTVVIDSKGAELSSMRSKASGTEYVWQADPSIWARHAPILFPFVGRLKDKTYTVLCEGYAKDGVLNGRTEGNVMIEFPEVEGKELIGKFCKVRVTEPLTWIVRGVLDER